MNEIWLPVAGYIGLYEVSNWARVKSLGNDKSRKEKILKPIKARDGYLRVCLCKDGNKKMHLVHRLVAEAFIPNTENLSQVNHKDEDKTNNFVWVSQDGSVNESRSNLEWCDHKYNNNYGTRIERVAAAMTNGKLAKQVEQCALDGTLVKVWPSTMECERNGYNNSHVSACCRNERKTHKGFIWRWHTKEEGED